MIQPVRTIALLPFAPTTGTSTVAPITWSYRIIPLAAEVMGYIVTPSIHINQDLATVWLNRE
jgi:hypothetical protein